MFESLDTDGLGGGGMGERMFRPMLVERYAQAIAKAGGVGVADYIIAELNRMQTVEITPPETPDGADR
jgi:Rod binding domain-containing protein